MLLPLTWRMTYPPSNTKAESYNGLFNAQLSTLPIETTVWDPSLIVKPSQIPKAGHGLYYAPPPAAVPSPPSPHPDNDDDDEKKEEEGMVIHPNTLICYYTGHVHT